MVRAEKGILREWRGHRNRENCNTQRGRNDMNKKLLITALVAISVANAQTFRRQASMVGGGTSNGGRCTVEVVVDGAAEVEIRGTTGTLRNLSGSAPQWRRFECTSPLPNGTDFRFTGVDGRGRQELVRGSQGS